MNLEQIAEALGGSVFGDATLEVDRAVHPADAESDRDLALAMDAELLAKLSDTPALSAIVAEGASVPEGRLPDMSPLAGPALRWPALHACSKTGSFREGHTSERCGGSGRGDHRG